MRRLKDVSNRSVSLTYQLRCHNVVSAWSTTSRPIRDLSETSLQRHMPGGDWIKTKKGAINLFNKNDNKCLQYAATVALNHEKNWKKPERISKIEPFIDNHT